MIINVLISSIVNIDEKQTGYMIDLYHAAHYHNCIQPTCLRSSLPFWFTSVDIRGRALFSDFCMWTQSCEVLSLHQAHTLCWCTDIPFGAVLPGSRTSSLKRLLSEKREAVSCLLPILGILRLISSCFWETDSKFKLQRGRCAWPKASITWISELDVLYSREALFRLDWNNWYQYSGLCLDWMERSKWLEAVRSLLLWLS